MNQSVLSDLSTVYGVPPVKGEFKQQWCDFIVEETLSFSPSGSGEHLLLWIEKQGLNTEQVAQSIAKHFKVPIRAVTWAGLKDKHGICRQWFGVHLPGFGEQGLTSSGYPKWTASKEDWQGAGFDVLFHAFNDKKLRTGCVQSNRFNIRIRNVSGDANALCERLTQIKIGGFANYFGEQRFGHNGNNIRQAKAFLSSAHSKSSGKGRVSRTKRALYFSVARSYVFNQLLSQRIGQGLWSTPMLGDAMMLNGTHSCFVVEQGMEQDTQMRLQQGDCHISGVLCGGGRSLICDDAADWEHSALVEYADWVAGLTKHNVTQSRRSIRIVPENLNYTMDDDDCILSFGLPAGAYATALLRECVDTL